MNFQTVTFKLSREDIEKQFAEEKKLIEAMLPKPEITNLLVEMMSQKFTETISSNQLKPFMRCRIVDYSPVHITNKLLLSNIC